MELDRLTINTMLDADSTLHLQASENASISMSGLDLQSLFSLVRNVDSSSFPHARNDFGHGNRGERSDAFRHNTDDGYRGRGNHNDNYYPNSQRRGAQFPMHGEYDRGFEASNTNNNRFRGSHDGRGPNEWNDNYNGHYENRNFRHDEEYGRNERFLHGGPNRGNFREGPNSRDFRSHIDYRDNNMPASRFRSRNNDGLNHPHQQDNWNRGERRGDFLYHSNNDFDGRDFRMNIGDWNDRNPNFLQYPDGERRGHYNSSRDNAEFDHRGRNRNESRAHSERFLTHDESPADARNDARDGRQRINYSSPSDATHDSSSSAPGANLLSDRKRSRSHSSQADEYRAVSRENGRERSDYSDRSVRMRRNDDGDERPDVNAPHVNRDRAESWTEARGSDKSGRQEDSTPFAPPKYSDSRRFETQPQQDGNVPSYVRSNFESSRDIYRSSHLSSTDRFSAIPDRSDSSNVRGARASDLNEADFPSRPGQKGSGRSETRTERNVRWDRSGELEARREREKERNLRLGWHDREREIAEVERQSRERRDRTATRDDSRDTKRTKSGGSNAPSARDRHRSDNDLALDGEEASDLMHNMKIEIVIDSDSDSGARKCTIHRSSHTGTNAGDATSLEEESKLEGRDANEIDGRTNDEVPMPTQQDESDGETDATTIHVTGFEEAEAELRAQQSGSLSESDIEDIEAEQDL